MSREFLLSKSPDGLTAEERLFKKATRLTQTPLFTWVATIVGGIVMIVLGMVVCLLDEDIFYAFGGFLAFLGGLAILIGSYGIAAYNLGLSLFEKAELLYNTRLAYEYQARIFAAQQPASAQQAVPVQKPTYNRPVQPVTDSNIWICACGTQNKLQYGQCKACGKNRGYDSIIIPEKKVEAPTVEPTAAPMTAPPVQQSWKCSKCGTENAMKYGQCKGCGAFRS